MNFVIYTVLPLVVGGGIGYAIGVSNTIQAYLDRNNPESSAKLKMAFRGKR